MYGNTNNTNHHANATSTNSNTKNRELFTLFTFCNKESFATERITILKLEEDLNIVEELRNFDINSCHCFGPDEEYKLRYIITEIGIERIVNGFKELATIIDKNEKLSSQEVQSSYWPKFSSYVYPSDSKYDSKAWVSS